MNEELARLIAEAELLARNVERTFGGLTAKQLNWKPDEQNWSIGQCLDHLIVTNRLEFPAVENALLGNYRNPFWSRVPFAPDVFGKAAIYLFKPENRRKFKAPKSFQPSQSELGQNIVADFVAHQRKLIELFERSRNKDLRKTKIVSPVSDLITYSLRDAFQVLIVHEQRHFRQAERILQTKEFPS